MPDVRSRVPTLFPMHVRRFVRKLENGGVPARGVEHQWLVSKRAELPAEGCVSIVLELLARKAEKNVVK
jgi:hypothetical protein